MVLVEGALESNDWENDEQERQVDANFDEEWKESSNNSNPITIHSTPQ